MPEGKIYHISYQIDLVVHAASLADAESLSRDAWSEAERRGCLEPDIRSISPVKRGHELPSGWTGKCLPILGDGKLRLEEILEE